MTDETTQTSTTARSTASRLGWLLAGSALHLLLWLVVLAYLCFYVPRQRSVFEDFGVELPEAAKLVIELSDLTVTYWYLVFPAVAIAVVGVNVAVVTLTRARGWRLGLIALLAVPPIGWLVSSHLILQAPLDRLIQELR